MIEYTTARDDIKSWVKVIAIVIGVFFFMFGILFPVLSGNFIYQWSLWLGLEKNSIIAGTTAPAITQVNPRIEYSKQMVKEITDYHDWCMNNGNVWVMPIGNEFAYCNNVYGEKIHP